MRRILLLITDLEIGGTPTVVRELALRLSPLAYVHVACLGKWGPVADQIHAAGVGVTSLNAAGAYDLRILRRLIRLCRRERIDTIFSFLIHANAAAAMARALFSPSPGTPGEGRGGGEPDDDRPAPDDATPTLTLPRSTGGRDEGSAGGGDEARPHLRLIQSIQTTQAYPAWHWALQRLIHPAADAIVVPTESVAHVAMRRCGIPRSKLVVIPNAIEPAEFAGLNVACADARPVPIGFIGRLDPIKRLPDLIDATKLQGNLVHLHIFGEGPDRRSLEVQAQSLGISNRATFHGSVSRPQEALAKMALLVLPSEAEGFGLVLIEAMAAGVPVVATDAPGIRDVVKDCETGLLVPIRSPQALATAIRLIIEDAPLRTSLTAAARADVAARFTWSAVLPAYRSILRLDRAWRK